MKILVTGAAGQVGRAVVSATPASAELHAVTHTELDIADASAVRDRVERVRPDVIVNAAAYTAVDRAENERETARRVNAIGPRYLAQSAREIGCRLIHVSTDFVFDGTSSSPYSPTSVPNPIGVYGMTKREGEIAVLETLGDRAAILRTAWVYASVGQNFLRTMLRLMTERGIVRVVADQIGTPTAANSVAAALWELVRRSHLSGIYHWTDAGVASWYDFAVAIAEEARAIGLIASTVQVVPIAAVEYASQARRPPYSVLDKRSTIEALGITPNHWRASLRTVLGEMAGG